MRFESGGRSSRYKRRLAQFLLAVVVAAFLFCPPLWVSAGQQESSPAADAAETETQPQAVTGALMTASEDAQGRTEPDENASVTVEFAAGSPVLVTGEAVDGWYPCYYQGEAVYVRESQLAGQALNVESLDAEMRTEEGKASSWVDSLETQRRQIRRSRVWRAAILLLIVAIFAFGIISALRGSRTASAESGEKGAKSRNQGKKRGRKTGRK